MSFSAARAALTYSALAHFSARFPPYNRRYLQSCRTARCIAAALPMVCFIGLWFAAADAAIDIEPRVGFRGVFQLGRPFPLEIELRNSGRPAEGVLDVQVWKRDTTRGGAPFAVNYRREVFLQAQARKTVQLTVDPDFISRPLAITFSSSSPAARAMKEVDLRRHFAPAPLLLLLSENNLLAPLASLAAAPQSRLIAISPGELAADPRALLGVSHVILYDQSMRDLSRAQLTALDIWLTAGGKMVIIGSLNFALYQDPSLSRYLPVRVTGTRRITFRPHPGEDGRSVALAGVLAQEAKVLNGKALTEADGIPVLVEASRGRGRIVYFALDIGRPPLSQWDGLAKYMKTLLMPVVFEEVSPRSEWNDAVFAQLVASPTFISTYLPFGSLFFAMLIYLTGVAIIPWLGHQRKWALRTIVIGLLLFITVGTVGGYLHFNRGGSIPDALLMSSTVLESSGDGYVEAQANLALFSTQARPYDLRLERGWMELTPVSNRVRENQEPAVIRQDGGGASRYHLPLREWDYQLFRMRLMDRFPLHLEFEARGDTLSMKVNNQSNKDLFDCWLLMPGQRFDLGQIARGARWSRNFPLTLATGQVETGMTRAESVNFRDLGFADKTRDILFHSSFFPRDGVARWPSGVAVFFGWVKQPEPRVRIDDPRIENQDYALFRAIVPLMQGEDE